MQAYLQGKLHLQLAGGRQNTRVSHNDPGSRGDRDLPTPTPPCYARGAGRLRGDIVYYKVLAALGWEILSIVSSCSCAFDTERKRSFGFRRQDIEKE